MLLSECARLHEGVTVYDMYGEIYNNDLGIKFKRYRLIPKNRAIILPKTFNGVKLLVHTPAMIKTIKIIHNIKIYFN